ncbi:hypothetical protein AGMMS50268_24890 [Spirochaetia bacterium]|nr:hypothetical protein AGMMS50268_24890 [Spirochaetia bacterium]
MEKQSVIKNQFEEGVLDIIDRKYLKYMPIPLEGASQDVAAALRSHDLATIEAALKPVAHTATNFMYILGMACLVIDRERLYEGTEFGWSYLRYAEHLVEELNIPISTLSEAKVLMEIYFEFHTPLKKAGFVIERNASKLRYLPEALENHKTEEVYKRIVEKNFRDFRDWAQKKVLAHRTTPGPDTRIDVKIDGAKLLVDGKNILNFPKGVSEKVKSMVSGDLKETFSIREAGNVPFIVETYGAGEQTAIYNFLKKYRSQK